MEEQVSEPVIRRVDAIWVYLNSDLDIVIKQDIDGEEAFICIPQDRLDQLINALRDQQK